MGKLKTISEVIELMENGYIPKEDFFFQGIIYKLSFDIDIIGTLMSFTHEDGYLLSHITFLFYENRDLKRIELQYYQHKKPNLKYCIYDHTWTYEQKGDAYYDFGMM